MPGMPTQQKMIQRGTRSTSDSSSSNISADALKNQTLKKLSELLEPDQKIANLQMRIEKDGSTLYNHVTGTLLEKASYIEESSTSEPVPVLTSEPPSLNLVQSEPNVGIIPSQPVT